MVLRILDHNLRKKLSDIHTENLNYLPVNLNNNQQIKIKFNE